MRTRTAPPHQPQLDRLIWVLSIIAAISLWVLPLHSHLWLDETGSYWIIKDGFSQVIPRCMHWPQSILYSLLLCSVKTVFGASEVALRLPSVVCMGASAFLLYKLALQLFDAAVAWIAVTFFVLLHPVAHAAADARPYALGLLAMMTATLLLIRWMDSRRWVYAVTYGLAAAAMIHAHYFAFGSALCVQILYVAYRWWHGERPATSQVVAIVLVFAASVAPLGPQFLFLQQTRASHVFGVTPDYDALLGKLCPFYFAISIIAGLVVTWLWRRNVSLRFRTYSSSALFLVLCWWLLPVLVGFLISVATPNKMFTDRYMISYTPGLSLSLALLVRSVEPVIARRVIIALSALFVAGGLFVTNHIWHHSNDDWGAALNFVQAGTVQDGAPVLICSQYVESDFMDWRALPLNQNVLFSPLSYYRVDANFVPLPSDFRPELPDYLDRFVSQTARRYSHFMLVSDRGSLPPFVYWLQGRLGKNCRAELKAEFGRIRVFEFKIPPDYSATSK